MSQITEQDLSQCIWNSMKFYLTQFRIEPKHMLEILSEYHNNNAQSSYILYKQEPVNEPINKVNTKIVYIIINYCNDRDKKKSTPRRKTISNS